MVEREWDLEIQLNPNKEELGEGDSSEDPSPQFFLKKTLNRLLLHGRHQEPFHLPKEKYMWYKAI